MEQWSDRLRAAVPSPGGWPHFGAIVAPPGGREGTIEGTRYAGGEAAHLCEGAPWSGIFMSWGSSGFARYTTLARSDRPIDADGDGAVADDVVLRLDGEIVPPVAADGTRLWSYDSASNSLLSEPPEGSTAEVSYFVPTACW